ncbi:hypothetical protein EH11_03356 [Bacillus subtilis]|nr:hypothetical protein EH11_03356 [Bacillus subtilis]RUS07250.1 hypothetical protein EFW59_03364 [Bacillus subtilis]
MWLSARLFIKRTSFFMPFFMNKPILSNLFFFPGQLKVLGGSM